MALEWVLVLLLLVMALLCAAKGLKERAKGN